MSSGIQPRTFDAFTIGDTVKVSQKIKEGDKERIQIFEGDVIAMRKHGMSTTFTVRKIGANSISVERIFPFIRLLLSMLSLFARVKFAVLNCII